MKKQHTENIVHYNLLNLPTDDQTDWKRVKNLSPQELENNASSDLDSLIADKAFWDIAQWTIPNATSKERITIRLDADVLDWLKQKGRGYQSRINAILRAFMTTANKQTRNKHHIRHKRA